MDILYRMVVSIINKGKIKSNSNKHQEAIDYYFQAIDLLHGENDQKKLSQLGHIYSLIGISFEKQKKFNLANEYFEKSRKYSQKNKDILIPKKIDLQNKKHIIESAKESKKTEETIYKIINGKEYTIDEWKVYENEQWEIYQTRKNKKKLFGLF